jgi:hypothetical protein
MVRELASDRAEQRLAKKNKTRENAKRKKARFLA